LGHGQISILRQNLGIKNILNPYKNKLMLVCVFSLFVIFV